MKANELIIGDWVQVYGHNNNTSIPPHWYVRRITTDWLADIESRTKTDEFLISRGLTPEHPCIGDTNPIPLTEEILMANGWYYDEMNCVWIHDICPLELFSPWEINGGYVLSNYNSITFKYVHELQHALRVCGVYELADNFKIE